jgi:hypothetical protein
VIIRLMNYCVQVLESQGMEKMFLDAVRGGSEGFQAIGKIASIYSTHIARAKFTDDDLRCLGFQKWASYKHVWRDA